MPPIRRLAPLLALSVLTGCANPLERPEAPAAWRLAPGASVATSTSEALPFTLQVARMQTAAGLDSEQIAYRRSAYRLDYYTRSRWASPPADMLAENLARALEDAKLYQVVLGPETRLPADLRLLTELTALEHVIKGGSASQDSEVRLALRIKLIDTDQARVLASGSIEVRRPAFSQDAQGAVEALNEAAREAFERVIVFCMQHTPAPGGSHAD
ncbi:MAG: ABC-type transport auxiliary lipoprotein family protein [Pseudomonadota bacterium]